MTLSRDKAIDKAYLYAKEIRRMALNMAMYAGRAGAHIGGGFSCIEILATLYGAVMHIDAKKPNDANRDRFIPSKAHSVLACYPALCMAGFFPKEYLTSYFDDGGLFAGKPLNHSWGMEYSGGSLGLGLSVGIGMALSATMNQRIYSTYVLLGDGEVNEGSVWEAIMFAGNMKMHSLVAILDYNNMQFDGSNHDIMSLGDIRKKFEDFGWKAIEVNGHSIEELYDAFHEKHENRPLAIIAQTEKAHGIPSLANKVESHHAAISHDDYEAVMRDLDEGKYDRV